MIVLKIAVLLMASLAAGDAVARRDAAPAPPAVRAEPAKPVPPKKPPPKRRAVHQIVDSMPAYGPRLNAPPPMPPPVPLSPQPAPSAIVPSTVAPPPAAISRCDAGGCTDVNGTRYNGAAGNTVIGPQGRTCANHGGTIQCF
ncbi:hypothetical protein HF313_10175 [Massilia atriviolacea]|uniref:DUF3761 domain-containing protein n=1 Tax=Massilia atriviolacea TaxID=2495579 RepID=A0A430HI37_9BURK|nr:hypothetical protein [Massilia atriviolacea]RSZ57176.1 hypothetical protein EJB06_20875 [Massilia atriviolacea]